MHNLAIIKTGRYAVFPVLKGFTVLTGYYPYSISPASEPLLLLFQTSTFSIPFPAFLTVALQMLIFVVYFNTPVCPWLNTINL